MESEIIRVITESDDRAAPESDLFITNMITDLIIYIQKFLDSDWLREMQF